jgi:predicted amidophosphoribosyltransferase
LKCPECQAAVQDDSRFCRECGAFLRAEPRFKKLIERVKQEWEDFEV